MNINLTIKILQSIIFLFFTELKIRELSYQFLLIIINNLTFSKGKF